MLHHIVISSATHSGHSGCDALVGSGDSDTNEVADEDEAVAVAEEENSE